MENQIDWTNPSSKISDHFTVKDALFLPSWGICHTPSEEEKTNILKQAKKMDMIRDVLNVAIIVHCWIRPIKVNCPSSKEHHEKDYNAFVKGAKSSSHILGLATDWHASTFETTEECHEIRLKLKDQLDDLQVGMEDKEGPWVHTDCADKHIGKFFKP